MSYQVIARKYRPQTFADLTGQEHISRTLGHALDNQRLHHAYLFSGVRGTGKTTSARILAKGLNCHQGVTSRPCLHCPSCLEIATGNSLDVLEIDAASNTGVDNVRDVIINNIALAPARDRYKVFVIDEVHMLSNSAFNALLKTLEEPPAHVVFIMATTELHKVPDTILSRCQQFEFRQIPAEKIFQRLRSIANNEQVSINDAALREIARAGAGSLRDAQSAFDQVIAFSGAQITEEDVTTSLGLVSVRTLGKFAEAIAAQDVASLLNLIEEITARGYDLRNFARELMAYWRHLLVIQAGITDSQVLGVADVEVARLRELAGQFSEEDLVRGFHFLAETEKQIKDSPHPRFQLEIGLVKLAQSARLHSLTELLQRLETLETNLLNTGSGKATPARPASRAETPARNNKEFTPPATTAPRSLSITPAPLAPASKPVSAASAPAFSGEPPDFPDFNSFDDLPPDDLSELDFASAKTSRSRKPAPAAKPVVAAAPAGQMVAGNEVSALLAELNRISRSPLLPLAFEEAQVSYANGKLVFVFANEDFNAKKIRESAAVFRELGEKLFGQPLSIEVRISGEITQIVDEAAQARAEQFAQAKQNPAVRLLLDKFKGEILSVRPAPAAATGGNQT
ncbi:MAG: DNA polymerase III subunit gamma/tau [Acidobacteria bacterium]|nr:DNA polymerase III subunit gamma/tau [Acidobacteriota bacterium]MBI3425149.1 DNA polymerase III subunit gamma/tau [Acidobacteriota bacterium]